MKIINIDVRDNIEFKNVKDTKTGVINFLDSNLSLPADNYNNILLNFNFISPDATEAGLHLLAIFSASYIDKPIMIEITDIEVDGEYYKTACLMPVETLQEKGNVTLGIYGYVLNDDETLNKRVSLTPTVYTVNDGSYKEDAVEGIIPTPTAFEVYFDKVANMVNVYAEKKQVSKQLNDLNNTLQANIDSETNARENSNNILQNNIDAEAIVRESSDNNLQSQIKNLASGSPLVASSISKMTDTSRVYVNTTDGNWYYYDGTTWISGGVYQSTGIDNNSIDISKVNSKFKDVLNVISIPTYQQGSCYGDTFDDRYNRIVTSEIFYIPKGYKLKLLNSNLEYSIFLYDNEGNYVTRGNVWNNISDFYFTEDVYIRFQLRYSDDSAITPNDVNYNDIIIEKSKDEFIDITNSNVDISSTDVFVDESNIYFNGTTSIDKFLIINNTNTVKWTPSIGGGSIYQEFLIFGEDSEYYYGVNIANEMAQLRIRKFSKTGNKSLRVETTVENPFGVVTSKYEVNATIKNGKLILCNALQCINELDLTQFTDITNYCLGFVVFKHSTNIKYIPNDTNKVIKDDKVVDLFMFMGQSNMAGRGITSTEFPETYPSILKNAGYEYRAITNTDRLYAIEEPFGVNENNSDGIDDGTMKTGSMVTSFANAYYKVTNTPIIAISASKGGTKVSQWTTGTSFMTDVIERLTSCINYLNNNGYTIRHKFVVWCQGESDGDANTSQESYLNDLNSMIDTLMENGIEKLLLVRIGNCNITGSEARYTNMIQCQTELAKTNENVVMLSTDFASMKARGLMKDSFHYYQKGYNEVGTYAGTNAGVYVTTLKEPTMYDPEYDELYYSHKN